MKRAILLGTIISLSLSSIGTAQETPAMGGLFVDDETYEKFDARPRTRSEILVRNVDLSPMFPDPGSQGRLGSCTGWAVAYGAMSYYNAKNTGTKPDTSSQIFSPSFQYNMTAVSPDQLPTCGGAYIFKSLESLANIGGVTLDKVPYSDTSCSPDFSQDANLLTEALRNRITGYQTIPRRQIDLISPFKEALQEGHPVIVNVKVPKDWERRKSTEIHKVNGSIELKPGAYHAMVVVGYNEDLKAVKLLNSWGTSWGDNGFIWVDYDLFSEIVVEAYTITGMPPPLNPLEDIKTNIVDLEKSDPLTLSQNILSAYNSITITNRIFDQNGKLKIEGYGCADAVSRAKAEILNASTDINVNLREDPWPICEIAGLITEDELSANLKIDIKNHSPDVRGIKIGSKIEPKQQKKDPTIYLNDGDQISIGIEGQVSKPFLQVYWLQADNSVKEIYSGIVKDTADNRFKFDIGGSGPNSLTVQPPFGNEALLVLSAPQKVIDYGFSDDTADYAFLDYLRYPSSSLKENLASADISIQQIQISSKTDNDNNWLVTPEEVRAMNSGINPDLLSREIEDIGDPLGPKILVESPDVSSTISRDNIIIAASFEGQDGATVLPETLKVKYKKFGGWFNVTDRVRNGAAQLDASGVKSAPLQLPSGKHRLKVSIEDSKGREAKVDIRAKVK